MEGRKKIFAHILKYKKVVISQTEITLLKKLQRNAKAHWLWES